MALIDRIISAFTKTHSMLPQRPTIPQDQLKAWYDQSANELKTQTNGIITDLVATTDGASGADQVGAGPIATGDVSTPTIMGKLKYLLAQLQGVVLGQIPPGTITPTELSFTPSMFKNGSDTFSSGQTTKTVTDAFITANTQVIISPDPTKELAGGWSVVSAAGSFTITSTAAETQNIDFDWGATK